MVGCQYIIVKKVNYEYQLKSHKMADLCIESNKERPDNSSEIESILTQLRQHIEMRKFELEESFKTVIERLEKKKKDLLESLDSILIDTEEDIRKMYRQRAKEKFKRKTETGPSGLTNLEKITDTQEPFVASLNLIETDQNGVDIPFVTIKKEPIELDFFIENYFEIKTAPNPYVYKKLSKWESSFENHLNYLLGIAVCEFNGEIYVADSGNKCVQVFSKNGESKRKIKDLKMSSPQYICINERFLYVSCWDNKAIIKLDNKKGIRMQYKHHAEIISGLTVDKFEDLYGCVWKSNRIVVWDKDLVVKTEIKLDNLFITEDTQIRDICYVNKEFYVLFKDSIFPVQIFNKKGELIRCPVKEGEISLAKYMTTDQYGNIIVNDCGGNEKKIKIFSNKGELVHSISVSIDTAAIKGRKENNLKGIGYDVLEGNIYICDNERLYAY